MQTAALRGDGGVDAVPYTADRKAEQVARLQQIPDVLARIGVGLLFLLLSLNLLSDFARTHRLTSLLMLASEGLVVLLTIVRRRAIFIDRSVVAITLATVSMVGPPLLRAGHTAGLVPDWFTAAISAAGLFCVIAGKLALGRSFGIVAANRGVKIGGPYHQVRHPIYAGHMLTHVGFLLANPQPANIALVICSDIALIFRALHEERVLSRDDTYREYCRRVSWHLVPGVF